ncbi:acyltransferase family protein [Metabacillus litoralis]|uniref:acyltransferase family protein n=1 Tax=Metabacillus litoralis TaxID=152268 RepID=UPI001CFD5609
MLCLEQVPEQTNKRDPFFDNARFILVALVVLGHLVSPARANSDTIYFANNFLASFRMPALILITGYFSKRFYKDGFFQKITLSIFIPYLIFQSFYSLLNDVIYGHETLNVSLFYPSLAMWFMLSLFSWNILLLVFTKLKHPILISFLIGIGIGALDHAGHYLSISRTFVFFPFFLIGHYIGAESFNWLKRGYAKIISITSIGFSCLILSFFALPQARSYLLGRSPYIEIADSYVEGALFRIVFYFVMLLGIFSFFPWVSKRKTFFTHLSRRTAYIYILHILFIKIMYTLDLSSTIQPIHFIIVPIIWLVLTFFLSSDYVVQLTKPLIEGKIASGLFNQDNQSRNSKHQKLKEQLGKQE